MEFAGEEKELLLGTLFVLLIHYAKSCWTIFIDLFSLVFYFIGVLSSCFLFVCCDTTVCCSGS